MDDKIEWNVGFFYLELCSSWIIKVALFDFIRATTDKTSPAYWAILSQEGKTREVSVFSWIEFRGLALYLAIFFHKHRKFVHKC